MREWTGPERERMASQAAEAAAGFLKDVGDPERDPAVAAARSAADRLNTELEAAREAVTVASRGASEARARLQEALATPGKSTASAWRAISDAEHAAAEARVRVELTQRVADDARAALATARLVAIERTLPAASKAVRAASEAERAAELAYMAASRAVAAVRSRAGGLAVHGDQLRTAIAGGGK